MTTEPLLSEAPAAESAATIFLTEEDSRAVDEIIETLEEQVNALRSLRDNGYSERVGRVLSDRMNLNFQYIPFGPDRDLPGIIYTMKGGTYPEQ